PREIDMASRARAREGGMGAHEQARFADAEIALDHDERLAREGLRQRGVARPADVRRMPGLERAGGMKWIVALRRFVHDGPRNRWPARWGAAAEESQKELRRGARGEMAIRVVLVVIRIIGDGLDDD